MNFHFRIIVTVAMLLALAVVAQADIVVGDAYRDNDVEVLDYDYETIDSEREWSTGLGEFSSDLSTDTQSLVNSEHISTLAVSGNGLEFAGHLMSSIRRDDPASYERIFAVATVRLEFTVSESSTMGIANPAVGDTGGGAVARFFLFDVTTDELLVLHEGGGGYYTQFSLEAGHEYLISIGAHCGYAGDDATNIRAEADFSVTVEPSDPVAIDAATWSAVRSIFQ